MLMRGNLEFRVTDDNWTNLCYILIYTADYRGILRNQTFSRVDNIYMAPCMMSHFLIQQISINGELPPPPPPPPPPPFGCFGRLAAAYKLYIIIPPALGASDTVMVERFNIDIAPLPVFTAPLEQVIINSTLPVL